ncbi:hypothetical protein PIB30_025373 [Stylosanthes scabra]|uniref:Uncharacterized protein n=1 Tax=Stylosanthes scabra TaxID=79078 RepID=A0ABU6Z6R9_9FABA|nr:hypothetical protein [Stylosanthes scabra]
MRIQIGLRCSLLLAQIKKERQLIKKHKMQLKNSKIGKLLVKQKMKPLRQYLGKNSQVGTQSELKKNAKISEIKQQHQEEVTSLKGELGDVKEEVHGLRSLMKLLLQRSEPGISPEEIEALLKTSQRSPIDVNSMHRSTHVSNINMRRQRDKGKRQRLLLQLPSSRLVASFVQRQRQRNGDNGSEGSIISIAEERSSCRSHPPSRRRRPDRSSVHRRALRNPGQCPPSRPSQPWAASAAAARSLVAALVRARRKPWSVRHLVCW